MLVISLLVIATVLLVPTYVYLVSAAVSKNARLSSINASLSSGNQSDLAARLEALTADASTLATLARVPSSSSLIRTALGVSRSGVVLSGLSYTPPAGGKPGTLSITGIATTRNDLRAYQLALGATPGFTSADLPVSSYAKDRQIPFVITVTLKPTLP